MSKQRIVLFGIVLIFLSLTLTSNLAAEGSISTSVVLSPEVLSEGGGQVTTITVNVFDKAGQPLEGVKAVFHASCFEFGDRNAQLSKLEAKTDASGKARVSYTSLAIDDKKILYINVDIYNKEPVIEEFWKCTIIAANQTALVCGQVRDPYTGLPKEDVHIHIMRSDTESIGFLETDEEGRYRVWVPIGSYRLTFNMDIRDQITVKASNPGQTYTVDNNKGILKGQVSGVSPGRMVMAIPAGFSPSQDDWTLQAEIQKDGSFILALAPKTYELFIVGYDTPFKRGVRVQSGCVNNIGTVKVH